MIGRAAGVDFALIGGSVEQLDGGVVLSVGSAIMAPQVFEKSISCVNNLRLQAGRPVVRDHTFYVVDLQDGGDWDWTKGEPPQRQSGLLSALLQELLAHGRHDALFAMRQRGVPAQARARPRGMNAARFEAITRRYAPIARGAHWRFLPGPLSRNRSCEERDLDRNGPRVYNVVHVRSQPGAAGTILNNLVALGVGHNLSGWFLRSRRRGLRVAPRACGQAGRAAGLFFETDQRRTFTYCKPLVVEPGKTPRELNRLDSKNWSPTPGPVESQLVAGLERAAAQIDALIVMDQVDVAETGVVTARVLEAVARIAKQRPELLIMADSRRGLRGYPPVGFKMNRAELAALTGRDAAMKLPEIETTASGPGAVQRASGICYAFRAGDHRRRCEGKCGARAPAACARRN